MKKVKVLSMGILVALLLGIFTYTTSVMADTTGPEITDIDHEPNWPMIYPISHQNVTVYATVTDPDGLKPDSTMISYCDDFVCYAPVIMTQIGTTDVWMGEIPWQTSWMNGTKVGYEIMSTDNNNNFTMSEKIEFFFVSAMNLSAQIDTNSILQGESVTISGSAIFNGNESAKVENSQVTITITDPDSNIRYEHTSTDSDGNFSITVPFNSPEHYQINVTLTNGTMSAYYETSVSVVGITFLSEHLQMTTCYPSQSLWVNGTAKYNTEDPVIDSDIEIDINGTKWTAKTDSNGDYSILITAPSDLGNYNVNVSVTNGTLVCYNETQLSVVAVPLPDLAISSDYINVTSDYTPHIAGSEIEIEIKLQNLGLADCENITIAIYKGPISEDDLIAQNDDLAISCGSYSIYTLHWTTVNGTHELNILVDPQDAFKESFEDNNNATITIFVDSDYDEDTIGDSVDPDDDNDGRNDDVDDFPNDPNEWIDTDSDGIGNNADTDDDADGLTDAKEEIKKTDPLNPDTDGDGVNDGADYDPLDPKVIEKPDEPESFPWIFIIIILVIVAMMVIFLVLTRKKED